MPARNTKHNATTVYYTFTALTSLAFALVFTVSMIHMITVVGLDPLQLVLVGTVLEGSIFLFEVPTGVLADTYSRRLSVIIGIFLTGLGFSLQALVPTFAGVLLAQLGWGIGNTFISGALDAWLTDETGEAQIGGIMLRASQIGRIVGIGALIAAIGIGSINLALSMLIGALMFFALGVYLLLFMNETGFTPTPKEEREGWREMFKTTREGVRMIRRRPALVTILISGVLFGMASEGYDRLIDAHIINNVGFPAIGNFEPVVWFGALGLVGSFVGIFVTEYFRHRIDTSRQKALVRALAWINLVIVGGTIAVALVGSFWLAAALMLLRGTLMGLYDPLYRTWVNQDLDPKVRATILSMSGQTDALGQIAGGPAVGLIGRDLGIRAALVTSAALLSPVLLLYARVLRRGETQTAEGVVVETA